LSAWSCVSVCEVVNYSSRLFGNMFINESVCSSFSPPVNPNSGGLVSLTVIVHSQDP